MYAYVTILTIVIHFLQLQTITICIVIFHRRHKEYNKILLIIHGALNNILAFNHYLIVSKI